MWITIGQNKAIRIIESAIKNDRISHAYLISGPEHVGKTTFALDIARALNCQSDDLMSVPCGDCRQCKRILSLVHTDVFLYDVQPSKANSDVLSQMVTIDSLRDDFISQVYKKPFEGKARVFIISAVEKMRSEQANVILKTLEEPPDDTVIILLSEQVDGIIETIVSRCQSIALNSAPNGLVEKYIKEYWPDFEAYSSTELARLSKGRLGWIYNAVTDQNIMVSRSELLNIYEDMVSNNIDSRLDVSSKLVERFQKSNDSRKEALDVWLTLWRDVLLVKTGRINEVANISRKETLKRIATNLSVPEIIKTIKLISSFETHLNLNISPRLALDNLMLKLPHSS